MKKRLFFPAALFAAGLMAGGASAEASETVSDATVMVYMIGSDLESEDGSASADLDEMMEAEFGDNINVIVQTGGAKSWKKWQISADTCERFRIQNGELQEIMDIGMQSMVETKTLADFVSWSVQAYPAERYFLVLWDHGGGTVSGYGYDENYPDDYLSLSELADAMQQSGIHLDMIGFDACLMGTLETGYAFAPYADYLTASEEIVPGDGWSYTGWLTLLGEDPTVSTEEIGETIVSDYDYFYGESKENYTLSVIDLAALQDVYTELCSYLEEASALLENQEFGELSEVRSEVKEFGEGDYEQIDIMDLVDKTDELDGTDLKAALQECVCCSCGNIASACGLAMYYPYEYLEDYSAISSDLEAFGYMEGVDDYFDSFISILAGGQNGSSLGDGTEEWSYSEYDWYDSDVVDSYTDYYQDNSYEVQEIVDKGDYYALLMSDSDWDMLTFIEQWVYIDDGEGYVDLGSDNYYETDEDGDLMVDFDYYWVALDGMVVPFYAQEEGYREDGSWYTYGYVPATLNETDDIEIIVCWDDAHEDGYVSGWRYGSAGIGQAAAKGLNSFEEGDTLDIICDYYTYDMEYDGQYYWGDPLTVGADGLSVSYEYVGDCTTEICYVLTDIYQNTWYTETVEISFE